LKYKGKTFEQLFEIAAYERSEPTYAAAINACSKIATDNERAKLLELVRQIARDRIKLRPEWMNNVVVLTLKNLISELPPREAVDFVAKEVTEGTKSSRQLCAVWIARLNEHSDAEQLQELKNRTEELIAAMVASLDQPGIENCLDTLVRVREPDKISRPNKQDMSPTQKQFYVAIVGRTSQFRIRFCHSAIPLLGHLPEVFTKYANDVLNSDTDPVDRYKIVSAIEYSTGSADDRAELFLEIANDVLAGDSRRLQFYYQIGMRMEGTYEIKALTADSQIQRMLKLVYRLANDISRKTKEEVLIPQLESMVAQLSTLPSSDSPRDGKRLTDLPGGSTIEVGVSDLEFLIEHLRGNTDVEKLSKHSFFRKVK